MTVFSFLQSFCEYYRGMAISERFHLIKTKELHIYNLILVHGLALVQSGHYSGVLYSNIHKLQNHVHTPYTHP